MYLHRNNDWIIENENYFQSIPRVGIFNRRLSEEKTKPLKTTCTSNVVRICKNDYNLNRLYTLVDLIIQGKITYRLVIRSVQHFLETFCT